MMYFTMELNSNYKRLRLVFVIITFPFLAPVGHQERGDTPDFNLLFGSEMQPSIWPISYFSYFFSTLSVDSLFVQAHEVDISLIEVQVKTCLGSTVAT